MEQQHVVITPFLSTEERTQLVRPALLTRFESVAGNTALHVISDEETFRVLRVERV